MRHTPLLAALTWLLFNLTACTTDAYDKGEGEYSLMQADMADMHIGSDKQADYFMTDGGQRFLVNNPFSSNWMQTPDSSYRVVAYYSVTADDGSARIDGLSRVGVLVPKKFKDMKTDPVGFESMWLSRSGRYLNASVYLLLGATDDEEAIHQIGCQRDTLVVNADSTRTLHLRLFHDQGGMPEYYSQRAFISIPLEASEADSVRLTVNTYAGEVVKTVSLSYRGS